jgi:2-polyprenyl-3-methyl-5-hydroxy-6-metoxy-1,4-benzoquinol methylase
VNVEQVIERKSRIIERFGEWTAHNIRLTEDVYTIGKLVRGDEIALRRILQIVSDACGKPLAELRVLDLACLEGLYAIELARHGASAVAVEAREANIEKTRFVKEVLALDRLELSQDDVRNLSVEKYGHFDAVLCLGILYHLDAPDVFEFVQSMSDVCRRCLIIDTHISFTDEVSHEYKGKQYWGKNYVEHAPKSTAEERLNNLWASIDNVNSFWFTRPSLLNLLAHVGFTSVYECHNPPELQKFDSRITLLALKGSPEEVLSSPLVSQSPIEDWPEKMVKRTLGAEHKAGGIRKIVPEPVKQLVRKIRSGKNDAS